MRLRWMETSEAHSIPLRKLKEEIVEPKNKRTEQPEGSFTSVQMVHTHTQLSHTQLTHTQLSYTHLTHTQLSHTQHSHTQLPHNSHTQLTHTQLAHTQHSHTQLSHTPTHTHLHCAW